jgi:vitamin B12 transporter
LAKSNTYLSLFSAAMLLPFLSGAQSADTLPAVKVYGKTITDITATPTNVQQLNKAALLRLNSLSVADAAKYFSGVVIKDYGGIGGLKTISVRSLGANHTAVLYDGISVGDAMGGQIDLGRFSLENIESIQLAGSQPPDILLPARGFASADVLLLFTPELNDVDKRSLTVKLKTGSAGYINPSIGYKAKISKHISHSIFGEYQYANGAYSFKDYETGNTKHKRENADIKAIHAEYDAAYFVNDSNKIKLKTYYYNSKRGLPGAVILYNSYSAQRQNDESFFAQLSWKKNINKKSRLFVGGKYAADYRCYLDPDYPNSAGKLENAFHQKELYLAASYTYKLFTGFTAAFATDYFRNTLTRSDPFAINFARPERNTFLENLLLQYKTNRLEVDGGLLYTGIKEKVAVGPTAKDLDKLMPSLAASVQPVAGFPLRIRASYKHTFRAPTFSDLYYTNIGNVNLRPEYVKQYNAGLTLNLNANGIIKEILFTADVYYNDVKDKILAVPRQNLFQWTMLNIGKADIRGLDISGQFKCKKIGAVEIRSRFSYAFQKALDVSNAASSLYKTQLPYVPEHSGSANLDVNYKAFTVSYNVLLSSYRYRLGEPIPDNLVQGWATQDLSLSYIINKKQYGSWQLTAEINNIFNKQYEIIKYYPMQGFNYRLGISVKF